MQLLTDAKIHAKVIALVARARHEYGIPEGCLGRDACRRLGLRLQFEPLPQDIDGLIADRIVTVSTGITWQSRLEFTIYHEITHHLLQEDGELVDYFTEMLRNNNEAYRAAIEQCCHAGAAEFLAPQQRVRECIELHGFSVDLIEIIARNHGTSIIASAIQLADCAPVDCYVTVCSYGVSPKYWPPVQTLYVEQAAMRQGMKYPLARYAPIPRDHLFHRVWETKRAIEEPTFVPFPSGKWGLHCYGQGKPVFQRVVGILYLGHPPRKGQLSLGL